MEIREPVNYVKTVLEKGAQSDDTRFSDRFVYHLLKVIRSQFLKQRYRDRQFISPQVYQTVCLELDKVDKSELPDCYTVGEYIRKAEIPAIMRLRSGLAIENLRTVAGSVLPHEYSDSEKYHKYSKHRATAPRAVFRNDAVYVINDPELTALTVNALFTDPLAAAQADTCDSTTSCLSAMDYDFHIEEDILHEIYGMSYQDLIQVMYRMPIDFENDARTVNVSTEKK